MDTVADKHISFNESGLCHHCQRYDNLIAARGFDRVAGSGKLESLIARIKNAGKANEYDCLIGVSGGVDSTYVAFLARRHGLRPLAVHVDNGWNSELAVKNIERVLNRLGIDLYTQVLDWDEFRDLQLSFLKASTPDGEVPTDHAIFATLWREAVRRGIRYIVSGMNFATESVSVPDWSYGHSDWRYIKDVHRRYGNLRLRSYPHFGLLYLALYVNAWCRIRTVSILNYVDYQKDQAMQLLRNELGWEYYGGKHHESIYTRFYQGYVLPRKFGIDKRYGHLSDLIKAGQLTREKAVDEIRNPPYPEELQEQDRTYVCKKLGLTEAQFEQIMSAERKSFRDYKNSSVLVARMRRTVDWLRGRELYPR